MQLTKEKRGECSILMVHGRLDGTTSPKFETEVQSWLGAGGKAFVLDMAGISFMSSAALRVLLSMAKRVGRTGGKVVLSSPNAVVSEVFEISNFSAMFTICQTVDEGIAAATKGLAPSAPAAAVEPAKAAVPVAPAPVPAPPVTAPKPAPVAPPPAVAKSEPPTSPAPKAASATPPPAAAVPAPPPVTVPPIPPAAPTPPPAPVTATPPPVAEPAKQPTAATPPPVEPPPVIPAAPTPPPAPPTVPMQVTPPPAPAPAAATTTRPAAPPPAPAPATPPLAPTAAVPSAAAPPPATPAPKPAPAPSPTAAPAAALKRAGPKKLEIIVGTHIIECRDGDVIGVEGTVAPHLFKGVASLQPRHVLIGKGPEAWFVMVPRNVEVVTHLDEAVLTPGVRQNLSGEHRLRVADFAVSLRLSEGSPISINESFFTRLMKILRLG